MSENNEAGWIVPKCYCIASYIPIFELHYQILFHLLKLKGNNRIEKPAEDKLFFDNEIDLLASYSECEEIHPGKQIIINIENLGQINYTVGDLSTIDVAWLCVPLFSSLNLQDLL